MIATPTERTTVLSGQDGWLVPVQGGRVSGDGSIAAADALPVVDAATTEAWAVRVAEHETLAQAHGARFLQLVVPDRMTLVGDLAGIAGHAEVATPVRAMVRRPAGPPDAWVDLWRYFVGQRDSHPLYWKSDDRWSPWAAFMALQLVCGRLDAQINGSVLACPHVDTPVAGRLALRGGAATAAVREPIRRYRFDRLSTTLYEDASSVLARRADPASLRIETAFGARRGYRNAHPSAVPLRVLLIGDEHTGTDRELFAGLLAETFAEVHVQLGTTVDPALCERLRPDVVILQLAERRLTGMPSMADAAMREGDDAPIRSSLAHAAIASERDVEPAGWPQPGPIDPAGVRRHRLFDTERYRLDAPITVQPECVDDLNDRDMFTRELTLVDVDDADVFFDGPRHRIAARDGSEVVRFGLAEGEDARPGLLTRRARTLSGTTLVFGTSAGAHCYYHWMLELLPKFGLLARAGIGPDSIDHVLVREITGDWQLETLERVGIPRERIVTCAERPYFRCERALHIDLNAGINLKMHRFVPLWLSRLFPGASPTSERLKLYISRPTGVRRGIDNEADLLPVLERHGYTRVVMEGRSVAEQAALLSRADVVVAAHGGALTNLVFCVPGTRVVELLSRHVYPYYYGLSASCGHVYHAVLERPAEDYPRLVSHDIAQRFAAPELQHATHALGFEVCPITLERMLARVAADRGERARPEPANAVPRAA